MRSPRYAPAGRLAQGLGIEPAAESFAKQGLSIERRDVAHTSHPTYGYRIRADDATAVWAPEFWEFPDWAEGADIMFAEASSWKHPIHFAGNVGGHMDVLAVCREAQRRGIERLVLAHIGRPTIRARDAGEAPPFGEFGDDDRVYRILV